MYSTAAATTLLISVLSDFDYLWTSICHYRFYTFSLACEHDTFCAEL
jgi:hypothetical protein